MSVQNEDSELVNVDDEFHMLVTRSNHTKEFESLINLVLVNHDHQSNRVEKRQIVI